jgi:hypothetical protein
MRFLNKLIIINGNYKWHEVDEIEGLFFVGDSTVSYGIGTDSAAHSALSCYPKIYSYLANLAIY